MNKFLTKGLLIFIVLFSAVGFLATSGVEAAGANLYLSPASGAYNVGDVFNVNLVLNSGGGVGVNASEGSLKFDPAFLSVKDVSKNGSVFDLWVTDPTFSNTDGTISYSGGTRGRAAAYTGSSGTVMTATFVVVKAGSTGISFSSAKALANDGNGTDILANTTGSQYTLNAKPTASNNPPPTNTPTTPPASTGQSSQGTAASNGVLPPLPEINSTTHLDPNIWYANNNPEFDWKLLPDISAVSYSIDQGSSTDPGKKSDGIVQTKTFANIGDGRDYFHLRFQNKSGWGPIATRQVLIDITPPTPFTVNIDNGNDPTDPQPKLSFNTVDVTSGIADYKFNLDGEIKDMPAAAYQKTPYQLPVLKPGSHQLLITVTDQAGNGASSSQQFSVEALKAPVITDIPIGINQGAELPIQGTSFYPDATINIYLTTDNKNIKTLQTKTDSDGNWTYFQKSDLGKGNYHVWAQIVDNRGALSTESSHKDLLVQSPSIVEAFGLWIIISLSLIIIFLILLMIYLSHQNKMKKARAIRETQELEKRMTEIFSALKEEVNELMELADKKAGYSESEKRVRDKINEALDISQEFISKEVKDVEKEIE